ncbi:MGMT family protein [Patescibacteria group bacterium]|nr:MGMT family protein [Patescibacteria group bacterium]MBU4023176.1 MGMT family protein [Patescibacteria group bacterium]MBU4078327.1 MGMT family protein [Patescibacteria group bacterium]
MPTEFQKKVYKVVAKIPKGKILSYKEVAKRAGRPKAFRAVGNIMATHNIKGLPCHRVIKSDGTVGGFRGGFKDSKIKEMMLKKEGATL